MTPLPRPRPPRANRAAARPPRARAARRWPRSRVLVSQHFQLVLGFSPLELGLWTVPARRGARRRLTAHSPIAARVCPPVTMAGGIVVAVAGVALLTQVDATHGPGLVVAALGSSPSAWPRCSLWPPTSPSPARPRGVRAGFHVAATGSGARDRGRVLRRNAGATRQAAPSDRSGHVALRPGRVAGDPLTTRWRPRRSRLSGGRAARGSRCAPVRRRPRRPGG
jgi:hypothetical protein